MEQRGPVMVYLKRAVDILVSSILLLLLTPTLFPLLALLIRLDSKGPVFFIQRRTGLGRNTFRCMKFRTMLPLEYSAGLTEEQRITPLGLFLRKSHLDELPQLFNVWLGQMSLVGPRPHMLSDTHDFQQRAKNYHLRHSVRPGITGLAQVNGFFGKVEDGEHLRKRVEYDIEYVYTWSIQKDLSILLRTMMIPLKADK